MERIEEEVLYLFPKSIYEKIKENCNVNDLQEIRVKIEKPIILSLFKGEQVLDLHLTQEDMKMILQKVSNFSLYAYEEEIKQGFITIKGGHRIGLAGEFVMEKERIKTIRNISSLNIRISREVKGCSNKLMKFLVTENRIHNTLIISPPKCGKTTLLRDITRNISNGIYTLALEGKKVAVIDERSEIGGCYKGVPQTNLGIRTDILDNCIKREGMILAIRALSPEVIICDEIGTVGDIEALLMAFNSGVNIIVTVHGSSLEDIYKRRVFNDLFENNILERVVVLSNREGVGTIEEIYGIGEGGKVKCLNLC